MDLLPVNSLFNTPIDPTKESSQERQPQNRRPGPGSENQETARRISRENQNAVSNPHSHLLLEIYRQIIDSQTLVKLLSQKPAFRSSLWVPLYKRMMSNSRRKKVGENLKKAS